MKEHQVRLVNIRLTEKGLRDEQLVKWMHYRLCAQTAEKFGVGNIFNRVMVDMVTRRFETVT